MYMCMGILHTSVHEEVRGQLLGNGSLPTMWVVTLGKRLYLLSHLNSPQRRSTPLKILLVFLMV